MPCSIPVGTALKPAANIDIAERLAEQRVAHRTADDARLLAGPVEHGQEIRQVARLQPCGIEPTQDLCHLVSPGTKWPSSMWAGV